MRRDGDSVFTGVTHGHQDHSGRTASVTKCDVSTKKRRVNDVCTMGAESSAFVTYLENYHDLGWRITWGLMVAIFTQNCQDAIAEDVRKSDEIATLANRKS